MQLRGAPRVRTTVTLRNRYTVFIDPDQKAAREAIKERDGIPESEQFRLGSLQEAVEIATTLTYSGRSQPVNATSWSSSRLTPGGSPDAASTRGSCTTVE